MKDKNNAVKEKKHHISIGSLIVIALFAICIVYMGINLVVQRNHKMMFMFGYTYSVVPTESMEPTIMRDDLVLITKGKYEDIHVDPVDGDIIIYYNKDLNIFVIHRAIGYFSDGSIIVKGDNNGTADTVHVTKDIYRGTAKTWGECFGLGKLVNNGRNIIFAVVIFILCFFMVTEIINAVKTMLKKSEKKTREEQAQDIEKERERIRQEIIRELLDKKDK